MGIAWRDPDRWNVPGPIDQNSDVSWGAPVARAGVPDQCVAMWTDTLLLYGSIFPIHGVRNDTPWIPDRELGGERLDLVRISNHRRNRILVVVHGKSLGQVSFCEVLTCGFINEPFWWR